MGKQSVRERLRKIMSDVFGCPEAELPDNPNQETIENWDSLEHLRLIMTIESEIGIKIQTERIPHLTSFELLISEIEKCR